jgi:hypothetical protein
MLAWSLLVACKDEPTPTTRDDADADTDTDADTDVDPPDRMYLRLVHVGEALGAVDVWIDGDVRPMGAGLTGPDGSGFRQEEPGLRTFVVTRAGASPSTDALARLELDLPDGSRTTLAVFGTPEDVRFVAVPEVVSDLQTNEVRYTFFAAVPSLPDVAVSFAGADLAAPYGERTVLGDLPPAARDVSVDLDGDGTAECGVTVQGPAPGTIASLYLATDRGVPTVFGHDAVGRFLALPGPDPSCGAGGTGAGGTGGATGGTGAGTTGGGGTGATGETGGSGASVGRHSGTAPTVP